VPIMQALPETKPFISSDPGAYQVLLEIDLPPLVPGVYAVDLWVGSHYTSTQDVVKNALAFEIVQNPSDMRIFPHSPDHGFVVPVCRYTWRQYTILSLNI
jgi:lipopolysaccharide transport system ATP-binding protein